MLARSLVCGLAQLRTHPQLIFAHGLEPFDTLRYHRHALEIIQHALTAFDLLEDLSQLAHLLKVDHPVRHPIGHLLNKGEISQVKPLERK